MTRHDLGALLEDISADVAEVDLGERSWRGAEVRRARSRRLAAGGVAAAAAIVVAGQAWLGPTGSHGGPAGPSQPRSSSSATSPATGAWRSAADGTPYAVAPALGTEESLPWLDVGLPREIDSDLRRKKLRDLPPSARSLASAVYLDPADGRSPEDAEAFHPVVILSGGVQAVVDTVTLGLVRDAAGNAHLPLDARALDGGRRLVFAQSGAVVVVDLPTAAVTRIPVPDRHLEWAGWATGQGGPHIVALSADAGWLIDAEARTVTGPTDGDGEARIGPYALVADPAGATLDESHGDVRGRYALPWPMVEPWGDTMGAMSNGTNVDWVASAAFLGDTTTKGLDVTMPYQGLVALRVSGQTRMATLEMRLAVFGEDPPRTKGCCRVVGWDRSGRHILYETETATGTHVLAWDIETGTFARVMLVTGTKRVPGGLVALGAGIQRN